MSCIFWDLDNKLYRLELEKNLDSRLCPQVSTGKVLRQTGSLLSGLHSCPVIRTTGSMLTVT